MIYAGEVMLGWTVRLKQCDRANKELLAVARPMQAQEQLSNATDDERLFALAGSSFRCQWFRERLPRSWRTSYARSLSYRRVMSRTTAGLRHGSCTTVTTFEFPAAFTDTAVHQQHNHHHHFFHHLATVAHHQPSSIPIMRPHALLDICSQRVLATTTVKISGVAPTRRELARYPSGKYCPSIPLIHLFPSLCP